MLLYLAPWLIFASFAATPPYLFFSAVCWVVMSSATPVVVIFLVILLPAILTAFYAEINFAFSIL